MGGKTTKDDSVQQPDQPARKLDESPREGGLYIVNNRVVDATGKVLTDWAIDADGNPVQLSNSGK